MDQIIGQYWSQAMTAVGLIIWGARSDAAVKQLRIDHGKLETEVRETKAELRALSLVSVRTEESLKSIKISIDRMAEDVREMRKEKGN